MRNVGVRAAIVGVLAISALMTSAQTGAAQGFFSLFSGLSSDSADYNPRPRYDQPRYGEPLSYAPEGQGDFPPRIARPLPRHAAVESGQAFCVRTCDGRYFPVPAGDGQTRAVTCKNFCPASETKLYYGATIDHAAADNGKPYSQLPNAFRYRNELVAGCTCNGNQVGLAPVKLNDDPTLRRGDIVAGANGLQVSHSSGRNSGTLAMSPAPRSIRDAYERLPQVAAD